MIPPRDGGACDLFRSIVERVGLGIFVVDPEHRILFWNRFLEAKSGLGTADVVGKDLFELYPEVPRRWFDRHVRSVLAIGHLSFSSWTERPYLFRLPHDRPISGGIDCMRQDCTFLPIRDPEGRIKAVCVTLQDMTEVCITQEQLEKARAVLEQASLRDGLTGLWNRRYLDAQLRHHVARSLHRGESLSAILLDIDHFKRVNDTHGHLAGDQVLRIVAERLAATVDGPGVVARYGGEEFLVLLPRTDLAGAAACAEHLRATVAAAPVAVDAIEIPVTISLGAAELSPAVMAPADLVGRADAALYRSKQCGRNRVTLDGG